MDNSFSAVMAGKSDAELQSILQNKSKYEPAACIAVIEELERRQLATPDLAEEKTTLIKILSQRAQEKKETHKRQSWKESLMLFRISKSYYYTPLIIYANVGVWLLMIALGVNPIDPSVQDLINWGGNLPSLTLNGELWRLLTSTFLHGGIFHLLLNMYALLQVGALLETKFGNHRYAIVYLVTGLFASMASVAFNANIVSVGASGAIFGVYGLLLALLITKNLDIPHEARQSLLTSTATFIGYNVLFGFTRQGIDNAAHIGGLLSGLVLGLAYYATASRPEKSKVVSVLGIFTATVCVFLTPTFISNAYSEYNAAIEKFATTEEKALWMYNEDLPASGTPAAKKFNERLKTEGVDLWTRNLELLNGMKNLPSELQQRVDLLKKYSTLRIESCQAMQVLVTDNTEEQAHRVETIETQIRDVIKSLEALNK